MTAVLQENLLWCGTSSGSRVYQFHQGAPPSPPLVTMAFPVLFLTPSDPSSSLCLSFYPLFKLCFPEASQF